MNPVRASKPADIPRDEWGLAREPKQGPRADGTCALCGNPIPTEPDRPGPRRAYHPACCRKAKQARRAKARERLRTVAESKPICGACCGLGKPLKEVWYGAKRIFARVECNVCGGTGLFAAPKQKRLRKRKG